MVEREVLRQRNWTEAELAKAGFRYYACRKRMVMGRELPASEAPLVIRTAWDTLVAQAGYMICFDPGDTVRESLYSYAYWPVRPDHFHDLYKAWDASDWEPTPAQSHLLALGCKPYSRSVGVWAKKLDQATTVQSFESREPVVVPAGAWLCMGGNGSAWGAPYSMSDKAFRARYVLET